MIRMKKISIFLLIIGISSAVNAGFNGLTHHSRANCGNNESISWDWTASHLLRVYSDHAYADFPREEHVVDTGWQDTWRSAAVHWGEGRGGWTVLGQHWMRDNRGKEYVAAQEVVTDCSIYDGWWDKNK